MRKRGFTAVEAVIVIVVLAILVTVTMVEVDRRRQAMLREESAANLRALMTAVRSTPVTGPGLTSWPPISATPGQLAPSANAHVITLMQNHDKRTALISPAHPEAERMRRDAQADIKSSFTDDSYWYLGYALPNEEAGLAFVEAYRRSVEETGKPPTGDIKLESPIEAIIYDTHKSMSALSPLAENALAALFDQDREKIGRRTLISLRVDGDDSIRYGWGDSIVRTIPVPIMIERPGLQRGGSNVLWGHGRVEFIPYPGKWPMTEKFIKALESLDELKVTE